MLKKNLVIGLMSIFFATSSASPSNAAQPGVTHTKLENGMEIVVIPDHRAPVITHMVWYKVGAADEPRGKSGIAHYLEHLMFKGTEKIAPGEFSKIIARNGGQDNAFTTQDATAYFQQVATDRLPLVMEMEADRMVNLRLLADDVTNERQVILEERRSRVDNDPSSILSEQMGAALFLSHPYGIPVIGWQHEIEALSQQDALDFYKKFYAPDNAILVVAGDVEPDEVIALAKKNFGPLKASGISPKRIRVNEPEHSAPRRVILKDERVAKETISRSYLTLGYTTAAPREAEALELLSSILGSTNTGRLYKKLVVEEKKSASAGAWYSGSGLDSGQFGVYAMAAGDHRLEDLESSIDAVLDDLQKNGITSAELERARNSEIAELVYDADSQSNQAREYGWALVTGRTVEDVQNRAERLAAVTAEDIQAVAHKYLELKRSVTGLLLPDGKQIANQAAPSIPAPSGSVH